MSLRGKRKWLAEDSRFAFTRRISHAKTHRGDLLRRAVELGINLSVPLAHWIGWAFGRRPSGYFWTLTIYSPIPMPFMSPFSLPEPELTICSIMRSLESRRIGGLVRKLSLVLG